MHCNVSAEVIGVWVTEVCAGFVIIDVFVESDNDAYMTINVILIVRNWEGKTGGAPVDSSNGWDRGKSSNNKTMWTIINFFVSWFQITYIFLYFTYDVYKF